MTIEKGKQWGIPATAPDGLLQIRSDAELANTSSDVVMALAGGDLWHALGKPGVALTGSLGTLLQVDALVATVSSRGANTRVIAASCIEIGQWKTSFVSHTSRRYVCVTNAGVIGPRTIAPRAHPNDGRFEILHIAGEMSWKQRFLSFRRSHLGTHVPHPLITVETSTSVEFHNENQRERLKIDHTLIPKWDSISITIDPDHWRVFV